jgi:hypothetical protein
MTKESCVTRPTPTPPLADTLDRLADERAAFHVHHCYGGVDYCGICTQRWPCSTMRFVDAARAAASELRRLAALETVAREVDQCWMQDIHGDVLLTGPDDETNLALIHLRAALATTAQPTAEGR